MKKLFLLIPFLLFVKSAVGQIVFEHVYDSAAYNSMGNNLGFFAPFRIAENEIKYAHIDSLTITIYNLDHTIFSVINIPLLDPLNDNDEVDFISRSLFDTDTSNIEYMVFGKNQSGVNGIHVFREDGTVLFTAPSYNYQPQALILGARRVFRNIISTAQGAKLILVNGAGKVKIWSLPGTYYPFTGTENLSEEIMDLGMPFPNPAFSAMEIPISVPYNAINPRIVIVTETGQEVLNNTLNNGQRNYSFNTNHLSGGIYFVTLVAENGISKTRKVIIK